jgi:hypothetical protein
VPNTLNPAPIVAPNIDTVYGAAQMDLIQPQLLTIPPSTLTAPTNPNIYLIGPNDFRYYGITFLDAYTNVVGAINRATFPGGGRFCLYWNPAHAAVCTAAAQQGGFTWQGQFQLSSRYVTAVARAWSTGNPSTNPCIDPQTQIPHAGLDGCNFMEFMQLTNLTGAPALLNPWNEFKDLLSPVAGACGLPSADSIPCGHLGGNRKAYWDTVCKILRMSPPTPAEAAYITSHFSSLGITADGNCNLDYAALTGSSFDTGYGQLAAQATQKATGAIKNKWVYLPFSGTWDMTPTGVFTRAVTTQRLFYMEPNNLVAYWAAFTDSADQDLTGANNNIYKITFPSGQPPVVYQNGVGFWSITVYEQNWFLHPNTDNKYAYHSNQNVAPPTIYLSNTCSGAPTGSTVVCLTTPTAIFHLLFRSYVISGAALTPLGGYVNPTVTHCAAGSGYC